MRDGIVICNMSPHKAEPRINENIPFVRDMSEHEYEEYLLKRAKRNRSGRNCLRPWDSKKRRAYALMIKTIKENK